MPGNWWFTGPFGYCLRNARGIPFIPWDGSEQLVQASPVIEAKVRAAMNALGEGHR
jgi:hypothetical protein